MLPSSLGGGLLLKDRLRDVPPGGKEEPLGVASAPCPMGLGGMETTQRYRRLLGLSSNTENRAGSSSTVGSPDEDPSTIHTILVIDYSGR